MSSNRYKITSPVLLVIFNRADFAEMAIESLRSVKPAKLYVAADGPRPDHPSDSRACAAARQAIIDGVDWPCDLRLRFREENAGVRYGVTDGIDWMFETESRGIILEDDIQTSPAFFRFADEMLEHFEEDESIASVCGTAYASPQQGDYRVSSFPDIWGWATWRDRWQRYDRDMRAWPSVLANGTLAKLPGASARFIAYWSDIFSRTKAGEMNAWDYQWILGCWANGLSSIHPSKPLVCNIGFDGRASNTRKQRHVRYCRPIQALKFPLCAPPSLHVDEGLDAKMWADRFQLSIKDDMIRAIKAPARALRALGGFFRQQ